MRFILLVPLAVIAACAVAWPTGSALAQTSAAPSFKATAPVGVNAPGHSEPRPAAHAVARNGAISVDGRLDEPAWATWPAARPTSSATRARSAPLVMMLRVPPLAVRACAPDPHARPARGQKAILERAHGHVSR